MEPSEARKGFLNLAYSKFKDTELYLEFAPENCLKEAPKKSVQEEIEKKEAKKKDKTANDSNNSLQSEDEQKVIEEEEEEEPEENTTLFVKNLNFETTDASLRNVCTFLFL